MTWKEHWHLLAKRKIADYDDPNLVLFTRWIIFGCPWFAIMIHRLERSDSVQRGLHDHPWSFVSFTLKGAYREVRIGRRIEGQRFFRSRHATDLHLVKLVDESKPTWTLVMHGRRVRRWGFTDFNGNNWRSFEEVKGDRLDYHDKPLTREQAIRTHPSWGNPDWRERRPPRSMMPLRPVNPVRKKS